uniref:Uncharacterized protein n=1 Tax=Plectus sambesii TaxID=2011161 RepID=A0A914USH6_9BILA
MTHAAVLKRQGGCRLSDLDAEGSGGQSDVDDQGRSQSMFTIPPAGIDYNTPPPTPPPPFITPPPTFPQDVFLPALGSSNLIVGDSADSLILPWAEPETSAFQSSAANNIFGISNRVQ